MRTMSSTAPSTVAAPASSAARRLPPRVARLVLFALAMGGFAIGTSEFAIMGLMPEIARGLGIDEPQVGPVISAYALGVGSERRLVGKECVSTCRSRGSRVL